MKLRRFLGAGPPLMIRDGERNCIPCGRAVTAAKNMAEGYKKRSPLSPTLLRAATRSVVDCWEVSMPLPLFIGALSPVLPAFVPAASAVAVHMTKAAEETNRLPRNCPRLELTPRDAIELTSSLLWVHDCSLPAAGSRL